MTNEGRGWNLISVFVVFFACRETWASAVWWAYQDHQDSRWTIVVIICDVSIWFWWGLTVRPRLWVIAHLLVFTRLFFAGLVVVVGMVSWLWGCEPSWMILLYFTSRSACQGVAGNPGEPGLKGDQVICSCLSQTTNPRFITAPEVTNHMTVCVRLRSFTD